MTKNLHVPTTVASRTALQLFMCVVVGMLNMISHDRQCSAKDSDHWASWPSCRWPPKASFQLITYVFLAEASVGSVANKTILRIYGTISGAVAGWLIILITSTAANGTGRDVLITFLTALCLALGQYVKSKKKAYAYMMVMFKLTVILVIIWGWDKDDLDTSFENPYWRIVQVIIGCCMYNASVRLIVPNFDRLKVRQECSRLTSELADAYEKCTAHFVTGNANPPSMQNLLKMQSAINGLIVTTKNAKVEWWFSSEPEKRNPRGEMDGFVVIISALSCCAACMQALRLPFDEAFSTPELLLDKEVTFMRDGFDEMAENFVRALRALSLMLSKPDIKYTGLYSKIRQSRQSFTHSEYLALCDDFRSCLHRTLQMAEKTRVNVLRYVDEVALTEDDIARMVSEVKGKQARGESLDVDGDGDFDADDMALLLTKMLVEQRVTNASSSDDLIRETLRYVSNTRHAARSLQKAKDGLQSVGPLPEGKGYMV
ncbi:hypothetical protein HOP50_16g78110 [Chloropicon primus]|uniref:Integral membrane bound transporter domain-containing protein n=1 Tax=Chloropicon primus TaxID=1764295 RepID=A0A5B8N0I4_9CHLO|nr:hypothetical protein A3770_16p77820 [Chloropicon primus]UPR04469.1 hypothetical protein HOP50_16g78110 [Chloropicon primus]|eukprot:QDZ25264.1 hypothetical protein A3770_16p77820 [Chloropicon primus]